MRRRLIGQVVVAGLLLAGAASAELLGAAQEQKGRYKQQGESCVWDPSDSGPNQCAPRTAGRFKQQGDNCVWDANDRGPDQCKPPAGRWKTDGDRCVWDPKDSGANQCNPRQPRK